MIRFSDAVNRIQSSPTVEVTRLTEQLRHEGHNVIGLGAGEPDMDTPAHIKAAAVAAIEAGKTKYTAPDGIHDLKAAICGKFRRDSGLEFEPENISVSTGGKQVLFNALLATVGPGDEVIVPAPYWVSYPDIVSFAGGEPIVVSAPADAGFKITPAQLEHAISPRTKWLILNSPSNPTGAAYSAYELSELGRVLERYPHVWVLSDEIYEAILYPGTGFASIASECEALRERVLVVNGVSKSHAMTGWRLGYGAGPAQVIGMMRKIQSQSTTNPCSISQYAAMAAIEGDDSFLDHWRDIFLRRRDLVVAGLNAIDGIDCPCPDGAFYVYPSMAGLVGRTTPGGVTIGNDADFSRELLRSHHVAVVHGAAFGLSPHFRISFATSDENLTEAIDRIGSFVANLR